MTKKDFLSTKAAILYLVIGLFFLVGTGIYARYFYRQTPHHAPSRTLRDVNVIKDWMTIHYVARVYVVPEQMLLDAVHVTQQQAKSKSIATIAKSQKVPTAQILNTIQTTIVEYHAAQATASAKPQ